MFAEYNKRTSDAAHAGAAGRATGRLDFNDPATVTARNTFKRDFIYDHIAQQCLINRPFVKWLWKLRTLPLYSEPLKAKDHSDWSMGRRRGGKGGKGGKGRKGGKGGTGGKGGKGSTGNKRGFQAKRKWGGDN